MDVILYSKIQKVATDGELSKRFINENDIYSDPDIKINALKVPYAESEFLEEYYIQNDGTLVKNNYTKNFAVTPLIQVNNGLYGIKVNKASSGTGDFAPGINGFAFYEEDGVTPVARTASEKTLVTTDIYTLNIPAGTKYVRFCIYKYTTLSAAVTRFNQWIMIANANPYITDDWFVVGTPRSNGSIARLYRSDGSYLDIKSSELLDKRILVFGDSIWGNDRTNGVADFLREYSGAIVYNGAVGGTRITGDRNQYSSPAYKPFDGVNLIHALLTQTWTEQDANVDDVTSYVKDETLPMLKSVDMSKIDIVILSYGHNDFTAPKTVSEIQSAFESAVSEILTAYPSIRILIITPPWRMFSNKTVDGDVYENSNNDTLRDIADGIVAGAKAKHIACLNMLDEMPWRAETKGYYLDSDEVHPNTEGNKIYAHVVNGKLRSMY